MRQIITMFGILLLCSCASIVSKSQYPVVINSDPAGAEFTISNKKDEIVSQGKTPTTIVLKSGAGFFSGEEYKIAMKMDGFPERVVDFKAQMDGWYLGNILFGGLIGMLIVDPATGAMWSLDSKVTINMESGNRLDFIPTDPENDTKTEEEEASIKQAPRLTVLTIDQVAEEDRIRLKRIN